MDPDHDGMTRMESAATIARLYPIMPPYLAYFLVTGFPGSRDILALSLSLQDCWRLRHGGRQLHVGGSMSGGP